MRISELSVERYGPLLGKAPLKPSGLTIIHGANEHGKSLAIDALCRMLFRKVTDRKRFRGLSERVEGEPKGSVVLESSRGRLVAPHDGSVEELLGLTSRDLANVFVVRDNDLLVEAGFFAEATDRLTGFKKQRSDAVLGQLRTLGALTESGLLSKAKEHDYIGLRVEKADSLYARISSYLETAAKSSYDALDEELLRAGEQLRRLDERRDALERAGKREQYHESAKELETWDRARKALREFPDVTRESEELWRDKEREIDFLESKQRELREEEARLEESLRGHESELERFENEIAPLESKVKNAQKTLELRLQAVDEQEQRTAPARRRAESLQPATLIIGAVVAALATAAAILTEHQALFVADAVVVGAFALLLLLFACLRLFALIGAAALTRAETRLRQSAERCGFRAGSAAELRGEIAETESEHERAEDRLERMRREQANAQSRLQQLRDSERPKQQEQIAAAKSEIATLQEQSGADTLEECRSILTRKAELEQQLRDVGASLRARLGTKEQESNDEPQEWRDALASLKAYADDAPGVSYDRRAAEELQAEHGRLADQVRGLEEQLRGVRQELADFSRELREILPAEESIPCDTISDLAHVRDRVAAFAEVARERARVAQIGVDVLQELQLEAEQQVGTLFGEESKLSRYFTVITGGRYRSCDLVRAEGASQPQITVRTESGEELRAGQLSGATYDQLYLSVRLALAEALLGGEHGFLILDDPFVRADAERLMRQLETLRSFAESGWQILYFTAKDEVVDTVSRMEKVTADEIESYWSIQ